MGCFTHHMANVSKAALLSNMRGFMVTMAHFEALINAVK